MKKIMSFFLLVSIGILGISNTSLANENDSFKKEILQEDSTGRKLYKPISVDGITKELFNDSDKDILAVVKEYNNEYLYLKKHMNEDYDINIDFNDISKFEDFINNENSFSLLMSYTLDHYKHPDRALNYFIYSKNWAPHYLRIGHK